MLLPSSLVIKHMFDVLQSCPFGENRGAGSWYAIYHHRNLLFEGVSSNPSINQPTNGKRTSMMLFFLTGAKCREFSGMIHWLTINNHPSNPQQLIHSLRLAPVRILLGLLFGFTIWVYLNYHYYHHYHYL